MLLNNWLKRVVVVGLDLVLLNFGVVGSAAA